MTGSVSMWAKTYHFASDKVKNIFLLMGIKLENKSTIDLHPFDFGKDEKIHGSFISRYMI